VSDHCLVCHERLDPIGIRDLCECVVCGHRQRRTIPTPEQLKERTKDFQLSAAKDRRKRRSRISDAERQMKLIDMTPGWVYDVGAAAGFFLKAARRHGWEVRGNEISTAAIDWCRKHYSIELDYGLLEEVELESDSFDAVVMWNTLEHCINPLTTLEVAYRILRPGGVLLISVPTKRWNELEATYAGGHLSEFTVNSLQKCAWLTDFTEDWVRSKQARRCLQTEGRWTKC